MEAEKDRLKATLDLEEPTEDLMEWAKDNINEDPDKSDQIVSDFRDMIFAKGECTPHRTDDAFLLQFLRARHFIVGKAHRLMVNYYKFKESNPQYFKEVKLERVRELARNHIISVPPYKDQLGRRLMIQRMGIWKPSEFTTDELFQLTIGILEVALMEPQFQIKGGVMIFDLSELSISQAWYMTPTIANHIIQVALTSMPIRIEGIHILYQSWVFEIAYNFIQPLINEGVKDRIVFHGDDLESLHSHVDPKHLPKRYGGVHIDYPVDIWFEDWVKHDDRIIQNLVDLGYDDMERLKEDREEEK
ncbi:clavesin-2 isoform X2 [Anoplophora glabripennis]|uniref:Clavesin-2 n=2 Tax=Anoplophora glabripennis TaxID=217634 RepID=V5FYQ9_ANOGL|nr:clavesin-2 isoform X2 [Anoplophora glabripennis]XP_018569339.1 clavesin-2 isoform X2 [Anoplophora glabripennis]XP_018569340.1 clavesin-2 isoform X2 [Anoplophora glabripennis]